MRSNLIFGMFAIAMMASGCTVSSTIGKEGDNGIGEVLKDVSAVTTREGGQTKKIVKFDKTVRRIHEFDLENNTHTRSFAVPEASDEHFLLYNDETNYIVDLVTKHVTIIKGDNKVIQDPVELIAKPRFAAFRPKQGLVAIYDEMNNTGLLHLSAEGDVLGSWRGGPIITGRTIAAGDLTDDSRLILAMDDSSIVVIDVLQSIEKKQWIKTAHFQTTIKKLNWVAPLRDFNDFVMVKGEEQMALIDLSTQAIRGAALAFNTDTVVKASKVYDPHVVLWVRDAGLKIAYFDGDSIATKMHYNKLAALTMMDSILNISENTWSFIMSKETSWKANNGFEPVLNKRSVLRYRFSDFRAEVTKAIPDGPRLQLTKTSVFGMFENSQFGKVHNYSIIGQDPAPITRFNTPYID